MTDERIDAVRISLPPGALGEIVRDGYIDPGDVFVTRGAAQNRPESIFPPFIKHILGDLGDEQALEEYIETLELLADGGPEAVGARVLTSWTGRPAGIGVLSPEGELPSPEELLNLLRETFGAPPVELRIVTVPGDRTVICDASELPRAGMPMIRIVDAETGEPTGEER